MKVRLNVMKVKKWEAKGENERHSLSRMVNLEMLPHSGSGGIE